MYADTGPIDGSWELTVIVTDLAVEKSLRVKGDLHIGGVMLRLVEALGKSYLLTLICRQLSSQSLKTPGTF